MILTRSPEPVQRPPRRLLIAVLAAVGLSALPAFGAAGQATAAVAKSGPARSAPDAVIDRLTGAHPESALRLLPADFPALMGYRPVISAGLPIHPGGGCSSPVPLPGRFEPLCRSHDFGYDVLRYAALRGAPVKAGARSRLDAALVRAMHRSCSNPLCHLTAEAGRAGLAVNTWRQRGGPPVPESGWTILASVLTAPVTPGPGASR